MRVMPQDTGTLHFIGIGGIGMSGIAETLLALGYSVQGSDMKDSPNVERLREKGIRVLIGHDESNILDADDQPVAVVVKSSAIKCDNPEIRAARAKRLPIVRRAEMLAELMRLKKAVVIGGTHGKTTTTSMVGAMLEEGDFDPTVINGGIVNSYGTNVRLGQSEWMVAEADESDGTFTRLPATVAVITNIDPEHMEAYNGSFDNVRKAYRRFIENLPFYGYAVLCSDHPEVQALIPDLQDKRILSYGFNPQADVRASNLVTQGQHTRFDVTFAGWIKGGSGRGQDVVIEGVILPMAGQHNVLNALAALAIGYEMGMSEAHMKKALAHFGGVKRRFTRTGMANGITVIDDYGHHPVEIAAVLKAARAVVEGGVEGAPEGRQKGRVIAVMQPHRYSRLHDLFEDFARCFNDADTVIIGDVYPAGEQPIAGVDKDSLAAAVRKHGHRDVKTLSSPEDLPALVAGIARPGDYIICLGAGDITRWAYALPAQLEEIFVTGQKQSA